MPKALLDRLMGFPKDYLKFLCSFLPLMVADEEEIGQRTEHAKHLKNQCMSWRTVHELEDRMDMIETLEAHEEEEISQLCNDFGGLSAQKKMWQDSVDQLIQLAASSRWAATAV